VLPLCAQEPVRYELHFRNRAHYEAEIRATFSGVRQPVLEVVMSRSSPGRYALHEFAKDVYNFRASDGNGQPLAVTRPNPYGWNVSGHKGTVVIEYTLYGGRVDGTYTGIDETHAHLNLPATLIWAHGFENAPASLKFEIPDGSGWKIATQLIPRKDGLWWAPNLEWLMDSPVEISAHAMSEWKVENAKFRLSVHHAGSDERVAAFAEMCKAVVLEEEGVFGAFPNYDDGVYTFLIDYLPYAYGDGMEHRDSTVITGTRDLSGSADSEIGTVSHEFFHSWNVKRIRPRSLEPFDFERADMSGELWFAEGFTNYYGLLVLERAGISTLDQFVDYMGGAVNTVLTAPGRKVFDVIDMSRMAPFVDPATSLDPNNFANTFISYYTYGQALALGIDLSVRERFPGRMLDDWMRTMWREHPDIDKPYTLADLESTLAETAGSTDFAEEIFRRHIYGMEPLNYAKLLASAGMLLQKANPGAVWLGARKLNYSEKGVEIASNTLRDSPLYNAGLDAGDRILQWDRKSLKTAEEMQAWLAKRRPGDHVRLKVVTRTGQKNVNMELKENPALEIVTYEEAGRPVTPEIAAFRASWLGSKAIHPLPKIDRAP
jgi:predicted metalloprotease with PDZ domain